MQFEFPQAEARSAKQQGSDTVSHRETIEKVGGTPENQGVTQAYTRRDIDRFDGPDRLTDGEKVWAAKPAESRACNRPGARIGT